MQYDARVFPGALNVSIIMLSITVQLPDPFDAQKIHLGCRES